MSTHCLHNQPSFPHTQACLMQRMNESETDQRVCLHSSLVKIAPGHQLRSPKGSTFSVGILKYLGVLTFFFGTWMTKGQSRATAPHLDYMRPEVMENVSRRSLIVLDEFELFLLSSLYVQHKARSKSLRSWGSIPLNTKKRQKNGVSPFAFQTFKWGGKCFLSTGNASASLL